MAASPAQIAALQALIQARADATNDNSIRMGMGAPGDHVDFGEPGFGIEETGQAWGDGTTWDVVTKGVADFLYDLFLPVGTIIAFDGGVSVPDGWAVCDGAGGTPNLIGRFLKGAASFGGTGGGTGVTGPPNATTIVQAGTGATVATSTHTHTQDQPAFFDVIYICRVA